MDRRAFLTAAAGAAATMMAPQFAKADELLLGPLPGTRYPDPRIEALDPRFRKIGNAAIERIATGFRWCEGPVYVRDGGYLLFLGRLSPDKGAHRAIAVAMETGLPLKLAGKMQDPKEVRYFRELVQISTSGRILTEDEWTELFARHDQYRAT